MLREQLKHREQNQGSVKLAAGQSNAQLHQEVRGHDQPAHRQGRIYLQPAELAREDALQPHQCANSLNGVF